MESFNLTLITPFIHALILVSTHTHTHTLTHTHTHSHTHTHTRSQIELVAQVAELLRETGVHRKSANNAMAVLSLYSELLAVEREYSCMKYSPVQIESVSYN